MTARNRSAVCDNGRFISPKEFVTLLCSVPVATTFTLTLSVKGDTNLPRRASIMKCTSSHAMLLKCVFV